jgi:glycosyltransferase involved in cell wall biosynthesis
LKIVILGGLNVPKGLHVVASLARTARLKGAPLRFTLIGPASAPGLLTEAGVKVVGSFASDDVDRLIDEAAPHAVFLPAIWPETWSFVLTTALRRGLPVVAFDIGAPAERLRRQARGRLLDAELAGRPDALLAAFLELRSLWQRK